MGAQRGPEPRGTSSSIYAPLASAQGRHWRALRLTGSAPRPPTPHCAAWWSASTCLAPTLTAVRRGSSKVSTVTEKSVIPNRTSTTTCRGVWLGIVGRSQSGRACAEPASRPAAPRSGGGAKRRALTPVSTRARCWLDDAGGDHNILRSTGVQVSIRSSRAPTKRPARCSFCLRTGSSAGFWTSSGTRFGNWRKCSARRWTF